MHYYKDFYILSTSRISTEFLKKDLTTFSDAAQHIKALPYGRNKHKADVLSVLRDNCGTCSTKHALLKLLAEENGHPEFKLMMGI